MEQLPQSLGLCAWALCAAWSDWQHRRLPNALTLGGLLVAFVVVVFWDRSVLGAETGSAWTALGLALLLTLPGYLMGKLGAGDVKFLMAMGLLTDWHTLLLTFVVGSLVGLGLGLWPMVRRWLQDALSVTMGQPAWLSTLPPAKGRHIPYGAALAAGFVCALTLAMRQF